jgi:hypothetical protein
VQPVGHLEKGPYFDLLALSAFAYFENGPAVSTGPQLAAQRVQ